MPKVSAEYKAKQKETIIRSAVKSFSKYGYSNTKMDDIASRANIGKGTLYQYFPSKEMLFQSICKYGQKILIEGKSELFRDKNRLKSDLATFFDNYYSLIEEAPNFRIEVLAEGSHNPKIKRLLNQNRQEIVGIITDLLKRMKKDGYFQKDVDLRSIASGMEALFSGLYLSRIVGTNHKDDKDAWVKTMMAIIFGA